MGKKRQPMKRRRHAQPRQEGHQDLQSALTSTCNERQALTSACENARGPEAFFIGESDSCSSLHAEVCNDEEATEIMEGFPQTLTGKTITLEEQFEALGAHSFVGKDIVTYSALTCAYEQDQTFIGKQDCCLEVGAGGGEGAGTGTPSSSPRFHPLAGVLGPAPDCFQEGTCVPAGGKDSGARGPGACGPMRAGCDGDAVDGRGSVLGITYSAMTSACSYSAAWYSQADPVPRRGEGQGGGAGGTSHHLARRATSPAHPPRGP